jgi:predicted ATP-grasp superfamily ATP-dependent carboligase
MCKESGQIGEGVVVPAIDAPSSVACIRSLGRRGVHTVAVSDSDRAPAFRSRYCGETVSVPSPHEDLLAYRDALLSLAARPDVGTILPVREEDVYVLSTYREAFAEHVATPWPSIDRLERVQDRVRLFRAAEEAGVPVPETRLADTTDDWAGAWVVKSRYTLLADRYIEGWSPRECRAAPGTTYVESGATPDGALREAMAHTPIAQEYLPSTDEFAFFALYEEGDPIASFQHRQVRAYNYAGGPSAFRESVDIPALERAGRALLDELDWHGLAMVEFLRDESTGEFKLMEVNPRFWSSLPFTVQAGVDFPHYCWLLADGRADGVDADYPDGVGGHLLRGEAAYLHSVLCREFPLVERPAFGTAAREVLTSLYAHPRFDYLRADDPRPFVRDALNTVSELAPR